MPTTSTPTFKPGYQPQSQPFYKRVLINSIEVSIFDTKTVTARTEGPFENMNKTDAGDPFSFPDVVAFGGFADNTSSSLGLSGLCFIRMN